MMNDYKIKNILESLKEEVENGKVSLREAAVELHKAGWTNFIDIDATRNLLKTRCPVWSTNSTYKGRLIRLKVCFSARVT